MNLVYSESTSVIKLPISNFSFLEFRLLMSRLAPYLQFVTTNCLTKKASSGVFIFILAKLFWKLQIYRNGIFFSSSKVLFRNMFLDLWLPCAILKPLSPFKGSNCQFLNKRSLNKKEHKTQHQVICSISFLLIYVETCTLTR